MSTNLLNLLQDQIGGQLASSASSFLGEPTENVSKALDGIFPSILGKMVDSGKDNSMMGKIFEMATGSNFDNLSDIAGIFTGGGSNASGVMNMGGTLLNLLMGNKTGATIDLIAKFAGLKGSTTSSLLKLAAPFLLRTISKQISQGGLNLDSFKDLILGQKEVVDNAMPSGLDMGSLGFMGGLKDMVEDAVDTISDAAEDVSDKASEVVSGAATMAGNVVDSGMEAGKKAASGVAGAVEDVTDTAVGAGGSLLKWLIPALIVLALLSFFGIKTCSPVDKVGDAMIEGTAAAVEATSEAVEATGEAAGQAAGAVGDAIASATDISVDFLKGAFSSVNEAGMKALEGISFAAGSAGEQMMGFVNGGFDGASVFRFKNLKFKTGSAAIDAATATEIDNMAAILNAYPKVKISVDGYTDNTGDANANVQLSKARADAVKARLMAQGIGGNRVMSMGHGSAEPVASNESEEGRSANRRIEISIVK